MMQRLRTQWSTTEAARTTPRRLALLGEWAFQAADERLTDRYFRLHGLDTAGYGARRGEDDSFPYGPTRWGALPGLFPRGSLGPDDVVIDYGSGKGRVPIWVASHFPVRRVIGVELDRDLHAAAEANWARWSGPRRCESVEFVCEDATNFEVPDDVSIVYFYNPFRGEVFERVVDNIRASIARRGRPLRIIYAFPLMHDAVVAAGFSVVRQQPNRSWVSTEGTYGGGGRVRPWLPPYSLAIYRMTEVD
ncbi:MAG: methyltransferase domain-containing protein [Acidimicrobiales bacterium]